MREQGWHSPEASMLTPADPEPPALQRQKIDATSEMLSRRTP